ncbi:hypothetical protein SVAN01_05136 [Stagonosporopsis vannaccii]|nr:hypothetical protein SVAN01_05136 [Stagonosporopsis vannaccii]
MDSSRIKAHCMRVELLHYGLLDTSNVDLAKHRLQAELNLPGLRIPAGIWAIEQQLKSRYEAENNRFNRELVNTAPSQSSQTPQCTTVAQASQVAQASSTTERKQDNKEALHQREALTKKAQTKDATGQAQGRRNNKDGTLSHPYRGLPSLAVEVDYRPFPGMQCPLAGTYASLRPHQNAWHEMTLQVIRSPTDNTWWAIFCLLAKPRKLRINYRRVIWDGYFRFENGPVSQAQLGPHTQFLLELKLRDRGANKVISGDGIFVFQPQGYVILYLMQVPGAQAPVIFTGIKTKYIEHVGFIANLQVNWEWITNEQIQNQRS